MEEREIQKVILDLGELDQEYYDNEMDMNNPYIQNISYTETRAKNHKIKVDMISKAKQLIKLIEKL